MLDILLKTLGMTLNMNGKRVVEDIWGIDARR